MKADRTDYAEESVKNNILTTAVFALSIPSTAVSQRLGFDGISPVRIGMTVPQVEYALRAKLSVQFSDTTDCAMAYVKGHDLPFSYMIEHGRVTRVDIGLGGVKSAIKTASGIGLGSTIAEIRRAYVARGKWHPNHYSDEPVFEIKSSDRKSAILFETVGGRVILIHAGRLPSAEYIEGCE